MDILKNPTINYKSLENIVEKEDFGLLKRELYKFIRVNFTDFGFYDIQIVNNFNYQYFAKQIIRNCYYTQENIKKIKYYSFDSQEDYYNILDFIILYSYQLTQGIYLTKTVEKYYHKSLTEIFNINRKEFSSYGLNMEYPYHSLSENYKSNKYIQNYLVNDTTLDLLSDIDVKNLSSKQNDFYLIALDVIKLIETKQGLHYKNATYLLKDRFFALVQCLKQLDKDNAYCYMTLEKLVKEYDLDIKESDCVLIANSKKYKYTIDSISEKIKYNFVRSKDFNYYNLRNN